MKLLRRTLIATAALVALGAQAAAAAERARRELSQDAVSRRYAEGIETALRRLARPRNSKG